MGTSWPQRRENRLTIHRVREIAGTGSAYKERERKQADHTGENRGNEQADAEDTERVKERMMIHGGE